MKKTERPSVKFQDPSLSFDRTASTTSRQFAAAGRKYSTRRQSAFNRAHELTDLIGGWGPFQWNIFLFDVTVQIATMANVLTMVFMAPKVDFICNDYLNSSGNPIMTPLVFNQETPGYHMCFVPLPIETSDSVEGTMTSLPEWEEVGNVSSMPAESETSPTIQRRVGTIDFEVVEDYEEEVIQPPSTTSCSSFTYDTQFGHTITRQFGLICQSAYLPSISNTLYALGYFIASLVAGHCADRYGRLPVLWASVFGELIAGISVAASISIIQFMVSRLLLGFFVYAKFMTAYTLFMELAGSKERTIFGPLSRMGRSFGCILITIIAYYVRDFRYLQLCVTFPQFVWIYWLTRIPESPRWLLCRGRIDDATRVVEDAILVNGIILSEQGVHGDVRTNLERMYEEMQSEKSRQSGKPDRPKTFFDLFRTPIIRKNSIILAFNWFITVFIYYALSLNVQDLGGNLYINNLISGLVEIPSLVICVYALKTSGRRTILSSSMITLFMAFTLSIPFYFITFDGSIPTRIALAMLGKFAATIAYSVNYLYSTEVYPTEIRQIGLGMNSAASRVGSMMAPFIKELNHHTHVSATMGLFGITSLINGVLVLMLPETKGIVIPDTVDQVESGRVITIKDKERMKNEFQNELINEINRKKMSIAAVSPPPEVAGRTTVCHVVNQPPVSKDSDKVNQTPKDDDNNNPTMKY